MSEVTTMLSTESTTITTITTGQVLRAIALSIGAAIVTVALAISAFKLGFETSRANIYEQQNADLRLLVGIVDQAKAREVASCAETGRADCLAVVGGAP